MEEEQLNNTEFTIYLTVNGTPYEEEVVVIANPNNTTRNQINSMIDHFNLPLTDAKGHCLLYLLGLIEDNQAIPKILELEDKDGKEIPFIEQNLQADNHLLLFSIPILNPHPFSEPNRKESCHIDIDFIIKLTIDGTSFEDVEVKVNDPSRTIRDQIDSIINVFDLPRLDKCDMPLQYLIGKKLEDDDDTEILCFDDENGHELCLLDYNIQPGDRLRVITVPCAYGCPIPNDFQQQTSKDFLFLKIMHFFNRLFHQHTKH